MFSNVSVLNFDQTYHFQAQLKNPGYEWIDLSDILGTNRYCDIDAFKRIKQRLQKRKKRGVTFIGSGNYHYVTYYLLSEVKEPFTLILFDYHTDMMEEPSPSLLSCGSWVFTAIERLPLLKKGIVIGVHQELKKRIPQHLKQKVSIFTHEEIAGKVSCLQSIVSDIPTRTVYISIDKDVLDITEAVTNWDQGDMRLVELVSMLHYIAKQKKICGVDICGEYPLSPQAIFYRESQQAIQKNGKANLFLLNTIKKMNIEAV